MSRSLALVGVSGLASLSSFASTLVSKATGGKTGLEAKPLSAGSGNVAVGPDVPAGVHTSVTALGNTTASPAYKDVKATLVRAVLPAGTGAVPIRDAIDVFPGAGIPCQAEVDAAKANFTKTAKVAVSLAKAQGTKKITIGVKQQTKFANINALFQEVVTQVAEQSGIAVETLGTAQLSNTLIMFPETLGVVVTADTPAAENIENMFAGILGGVARTYHADEAQIAAGNSPFSVARAISTALAAQGQSAEAKKIEEAVAKAKPNDGGASIISAL